jgi:hypothetical protein
MWEGSNKGVGGKYWVPMRDDSVASVSLAVIELFVYLKDSFCTGDRTGSLVL